MEIFTYVNCCISAQDMASMRKAFFLNETWPRILLSNKWPANLFILSACVVSWRKKNLSRNYFIKTKIFSFSATDSLILINESAVSFARLERWRFMSGHQSSYATNWFISNVPCAITKTDISSCFALLCWKQYLSTECILIPREGKGYEKQKSCFLICKTY